MTCKFQSDAQASFLVNKVMNVFYPQFQNPFGYDNINDRQRYLHHSLYNVLHRHAPNDGGFIVPPIPTAKTTFVVIDSITNEPIKPDKILIDGRNTKFDFDPNEQNITIDVPESKSFAMVIIKSNYIAFDEETTIDSIDGSTQYIVPKTKNITFKLVDSKTNNPIDPDSITIDGEETQFSSSSGNVTLDVPTTGRFIIVIMKENYVSFVEELSLDEIESSSQSLTPEQHIDDEEESKVTWKHSAVKDLDTHLLVFDSSGKKLTEIYYNRKEYSDSNVTISLDRDDTGDGQYDGETVTISPLYHDYKFILVLYDFTNGGNVKSSAMSNSEAKFTITYNNIPQTTYIPKNVPGVFWNVYRVENGEIDMINTVTTTNDYGITPRNRGGK